MLFYYILRIFLGTLKSKKTFKDSDYYKGIVFYFNTPSKDRKNILKVLIEMEKLSWYWRTYPTSYFLFEMHLKEFNNYSNMKSFVPQDFYSKFAGSTKYDVLIDDKILFHDIMMMYNLPVSKHYFTFRNNQFYIDSKIANDQEVNNVISEIKDERIFVKRYRGGGGSGVFVFNKREDGYYNETNNKLTAAYIKSEYNNITILFEKQIIQDSVLSKFNNDTVNTFRVQVIKAPNGNFQIISACVRFGRKGSFVDNAHKGGIVVSLDIDTGKLGDYGSRLFDLNKYYVHPDSKLPFKNTMVREWQEVSKLVYKTMGYIPFYNGVAFDIANTIEGPIIIEINTGAGMDAPQMARDKGIAEFFNKGKKNDH